MPENGLEKPYKNARTCLWICLISALLTSGILFVIFALLGLAPFGNRGVLYRDGQLQMVDLFCWYKDVLSGKASIDYTFTKSLGGSNFAVFAYYLSSPVSLLMVFFKKSQASLFMNIAFLIKCALASGFTAFYLTDRFHPSEKSKYAWTVLLSISYGLSQFFISQSSNIMWLDGAYMLPLLLTGTERVLAGKKSTLLIVSSALAIIFNWYTGIIDIMFACFWFLFDLIRRTVAKKNTTSEKALVSKDGASDVKSMLNAALRFGVSMICAALLASCLLIPTITLLSDRTHGSVGLSMIKDLSMIGFLPDVISNYAMGMINLKGSVSLFAGSFVLLGVILFFVAGAQKLKEKLVYGGFLLFTILTFYWQPLVALFSLLRVVEAFWYRYSYIGSFLLICIAAEFYMTCDMKKVKPWMPPMAACGFGALTVLISQLASFSGADYYFAVTLELLTGTEWDTTLTPLFGKMLFPIVLSLFMSLYLVLGKEKATARRVLTGALSIVLVLELSLSQAMFMQIYAPTSAVEISRYTEQELSMLKIVKKDSACRTTQTTYHSLQVDVPASYNEAMAYGFPSVTSFVSDPEESTITFLDRAGYPGYSDTITCTASENLALDALLGVKYVLLPEGDPNHDGLTYLTGLAGFKDLYGNPFCGSLAFYYEGEKPVMTATDNPAEYLNELYKALLPVEDLFTEVSSELSREEATWRYTVDLGEDFAPGSAVLYVNLITNTDSGATLYANGEAITPYSTYLAPTFVRIPTSESVNTIDLVFEGNHAEDGEVIDAQFYLLDLIELSRARFYMANERAAEADIFEDGHVQFIVSYAPESSRLFTSIPMENGWTVTVNGKKVAIELIDDTLITVPLETGSNIIEMKYQVPRKSLGIACSFAGLLLLGVILFLERQQTMKKREE